MGLEPSDGVAACQGGDAAGGDQGDAGEPQRAPAWLRCGGGTGAYPTESCPAVVGACPVIDDRHLCRGHRARGTGDRGSDVDLMPEEVTRQTPGGMLRVTSHAYCPW